MYTTCGVSFCIDVVILNFVLLLVKLIFSEKVDSVSMSSCVTQQYICVCISVYVKMWTLDNMQNSVDLAFLLARHWCPTDNSVTDL